MTPAPSPVPLRAWTGLPGVLEVFPVDLERLPPGVDTTALSSDELARAARFRPGRHARLFVNGRAWLRHVLGCWRREEPSRLNFRYNQQGKPWLQGGPEFNLAHCENAAVLALGDKRRVGVDIERLRPAPDEDKDDDLVAEQFFAPGERARLRRLPETERPAAFLRCWTRKEALLKALGGGLSLPLDAFEVSFGAGEQPALLTSTWPWAQPGDWALRDLSEIWPGHVVALAFARPMTPDGTTPNPAQELVTA